MQGPLVWGRVLAARSVTPVLALLGCGAARWRGMRVRGMASYSNRAALG